MVVVPRHARSVDGWVDGEEEEEEGGEQKTAGIAACFLFPGFDGLAGMQDATTAPNPTRGRRGVWRGGDGDGDTTGLQGRYDSQACAVRDHLCCFESIQMTWFGTDVHSILLTRSPNPSPPFPERHSHQSWCVCLSGNLGSIFCAPRHGMDGQMEAAQGTLTGDCKVLINCLSFLSLTGLDSDGGGEGEWCKKGRGSSVMAQEP